MDNRLGGVGAAEWSVWSTDARLVVTDPAALTEARRVTVDALRRIGDACSRFQPDSELCRLPAGRPTEVSQLLANLVAVALEAAWRTDGDVDPTVGGALAELGYDRDLREITDDGTPLPWVSRPVPGWQRVTLRDRVLTVPEGVTLDLGATAKAFAADLCADLVSARCGTGVLVSIGGDIATAGPGPEGGWQVLVRDRPSDPSCLVRLADGAALATSSTASRWWQRGGRRLHHIIDPSTCLPAEAVWRTVSVAATTCVAANTATTAALVRGERGLDWLRDQGVTARLVAHDNHIVTTGGWPQDPLAELAEKEPTANHPAADRPAADHPTEVAAIAPTTSASRATGQRPFDAVAPDVAAAAFGTGRAVPEAAGRRPGDGRSGAGR